MPQIRVATWNSTGEDANKAAHLVAAVTMENAGVAALPPPPQPPVTLVAIQEARVQDANIQAALNNAGPGPFATFLHPPEACREGPLQGNPGRRYLLGWETAGVFALTSPLAAAPLQRIDLANDAGVINYINNTVGAKIRTSYKTQLRLSVRTPAWRELSIAGRTVIFITWHAPQRGGLITNSHPLYPDWSQGFRDVFVLWEQSSWYANRIATLGANNIAILAGDLNADALEIKTTLPSWRGFTHNLSHILAYTNAHNEVVDQGSSYVNPPGVGGDHSIVMARISWP